MWWDGVRIGRGGTVGDRPETEIPGPVETHHAIPDSLATPGSHVLALRTSAFHLGFSPANTYSRLAVGPLEDSIKKRPNAPLVLYHLGLTYAKLGDKAKARVALERAVKLDPKVGGDEARRTLALVSQ